MTPQGALDEGARREQAADDDEQPGDSFSSDRSHRSALFDDAPDGAASLPVPPLGMSRKLWKVASNKTTEAFETTREYEARTSVDVARMLRAAGQGSLEGSGKAGGLALWEWHGEGAMTERVAGWARWVNRGAFGCEAGLAEQLASDALIDPVGSLLKRPELDEPLSEAEVAAVKTCLLDELRVTGKVTDKAVENYMAEMASQAMVRGPEHAVTRAQIRLANQPLPGADDPNTTIRRWFCLQGVQQKASHSCAQLAGSPLLLGTGPNGGHDGVGHMFKPVSAEYQKNVERNTRKTRKAALPALMLHGNDINQLPFYRDSRNTEVAGFLTDMLEMQVRCVVACGFVCAHEEDNLKVLLRCKGPYANPRKLLHHDPLNRHSRPIHPSYQKGAPRDFFNYFGSPTGDDGLKWKRVETRHYGIQTREARVPPLLLRSTMLARDNTLGPEGGSYKVAVFKLEVSWHEGLPFFGRNQSAEIQVVHIQVADQAPAQLTRPQVRLLYNAVAGNAPDSVELGFEKAGRTFVHCHAGIGRTGNIAFGLSELLCAEVPCDPKEKLAWLRKHRPGAVQSPEQLVDGLQLAAGILDEVFERVKYSPLVALQKARDRVRGAMEAELRESLSAAGVPRTSSLREVMLPLSGSNSSLRGLLKGAGRPKSAAADAVAGSKKAQPPDKSREEAGGGAPAGH